LPKRTCKHARGLNRKWVYNGKEVNGKEVNGKEVNGKEVNGKEVNGKEVDQGIARKAQQEPEGEMEGTETAAAAEALLALA
jgi:hypothetical protein